MTEAFTYKVTQDECEDFLRQLREQFAPFGGLVWGYYPNNRARVVFDCNIHIAAVRHHLQSAIFAWIAEFTR